MKQVQYPSKRRIPLWDNVNKEYSVIKFPETGATSKVIGHQWWPPPDVLKKHESVANKIVYNFIPKVSSKVSNYDYDFRIRDELMRSQSSKDFSYKSPETVLFCKHSSVRENHFIYPPSRNLEKGLSLTAVHGTSEMRDAYITPTISSRLATRKQQYEHPFTLPFDHHPPTEDPSWEKKLENLDTTYDGYEKYLDIYLTSSRLHHRPFTADQLSKPSNNNDVVTYYTFCDTPWVRRKKASEGDWWLPKKWPILVTDREKFMPRREVITHNKLKPVPGAYRTEVRDNYHDPNLKPLFVERRKIIKSVLDVCSDPKCPAINCVDTC